MLCRCTYFFFNKLDAFYRELDQVHLEQVNAGSGSARKPRRSVIDEGAVDPPAKMKLIPSWFSESVEKETAKGGADGDVAAASNDADPSSKLPSGLPSDLHSGLPSFFYSPPLDMSIINAPTPAFLKSTPTPLDGTISISPSEYDDSQ